MAERIFYHSNCKHRLQGLLLTIYQFLNLSNKKAVILSAALSVCASGNGEKIKTVPVLTRLPHALAS